MMHNYADIGPMMITLGSLAELYSHPATNPPPVVGIRPLALRRRPTRDCDVEQNNTGIDLPSALFFY